MDENQNSPNDLHFGNLAPAIEFVCRVVIVLAQLLRLNNGPAVTDDQFVIPIALFSAAALGAVSLRIDHLCR